MDIKVAKIDEQHQELFRQADTLLNQTKNGKIIDIRDHIMVHDKELAQYYRSLKLKIKK